MGSKFHPNPYNGTGWESPLNGVGSNFIPSQLSGNRKFSQPNPLSRGLVFPAGISHPGGHTTIRRSGHLAPATTSRPVHRLSATSNPRSFRKLQSTITLSKMDQIEQALADLRLQDKPNIQA